MNLLHFLFHQLNIVNFYHIKSTLYILPDLLCKSVSGEIEGERGRVKKTSMFKNS